MLQANSIDIIIFYYTRKNHKTLVTASCIPMLWRMYYLCVCTEGHSYFPPSSPRAANLPVPTLPSVLHHKHSLGQGPSEVLDLNHPKLCAPLICNLLTSWVFNTGAYEPVNPPAGSWAHVSVGPRWKHCPSISSQCSWLALNKMARPLVNRKQTIHFWYV